MLGPALILFWFGSAYALWIYEHDFNPAAKTFGGALYLSFLTASTVGYGGMTLATAIGMPLTAIEPRITAAVLGGAFMCDALSDAARRITIPTQVLLPWDDEEISRQHSLALFDTFAAKEKTLHAIPGGHREVPWFEVEDSARFFHRHLR